MQTRFCVRNARLTELPKHGHPAALPDLHNHVAESLHTAVMCNVVPTDGDQEQSLGLYLSLKKLSSDARAKSSPAGGRAGKFDFVGGRRLRDPMTARAAAPARELSIKIGDA